MSSFFLQPNDEADAGDDDCLSVGSVLVAVVVAGDESEGGKRRQVKQRLHFMIIHRLI